MPTNANDRYSSTCADLDKQIEDLKVRIRVSESNEQLRNNYQEKLKTLEDNIAYCNGVLDILKPMITDIQEYITKRRENSMQSINNALRMAGEIIQDATEGIYFNLDKDEAWLTTPDGLEVDLVEGGGYRQISSTFIRSVVAASNPDILKTMMLDEIFGLVSPENSSILSIYLNVICQNMQIISIEQKPQVYSNIDCTAYQFNKIGKFTEVTRKEIKSGSNIQEAFTQQEGVDDGSKIA